MKSLSISLAVAFGIFLSIPSLQAAHYEIDTAHSSVNFKIGHLFSKVNGTFNEFSGTVQYEPGKPEAWGTHAVIKASSIDTNNENRDKHLRSADFFDVEKYPEITFKSTKIESTGENTAKLEGTLSMHGVEKPVVLDLEIHGIGKDPWGNTRAGFTAKGKINRKDFGIVYNQKLETGNLLLGEEVEIILEVEGLLKE